MQKLVIDENECIGCDLCVDLCPKLFTSTDYVPRVNNVDVTNMQCAEDSVELCPARAIKIVKV